MPMAVTSDAKGRTRRKQQAGRSMKLKNPVKRRSAAAAALADGRYRNRVMKSAKVYSRKKKSALPNEDDE
jgi:hypothetical protein